VLENTTGSPRRRPRRGFSAAPGRLEYVWFNTGQTFQETTTRATLACPEINVENVLRLPDSKSGFLGSGYWNFAGRSFVEVGWVGFAKSRTETIAQDIILGDTTYTAGASISTSIKSSMPYVGSSFRWTPRFGS